MKPYLRAIEINYKYSIGNYLMGKYFTKKNPLFSEKAMVFYLLIDLPSFFIWFVSLCGGIGAGW